MNLCGELLVINNNVRSSRENDNDIFVFVGKNLKLILPFNIMWANHVNDLYLRKYTKNLYDIDSDFAVFIVFHSKIDLYDI